MRKEEREEKIIETVDMAFYYMATRPEVSVSFVCMDEEMGAEMIAVLFSRYPESLLKFDSSIEVWTTN